MTQTNNPAKLLAALLVATGTGEAQWQTLSDAYERKRGPFGHDDVTSEPLVCRWRERWFRVYEYQYKYWTDEDAYEWIRSVAVEICQSPGGLTVYEFNGAANEAIELLRAAQAAVAGIDDLVAELEDF